jgi:hypothetical protein
MLLLPKESIAQGHCWTVLERTLGEERGTVLDRVRPFRTVEYNEHVKLIAWSIHSRFYLRRLRL